VGVARALAADPPVLLMDEPFGAVDPIARDRLQEEFLRLHAELGFTVLFVTHDIEEAVRLGDRIAVMREGGHLEQYDTPATILGNPATDFVADFVGADRGLKRLAVTRIRPEDLDHPPVVRLGQSASEAAQTLAAAGARWGVVLDEAGNLHGWVGRDRLGSGQSVADAVRRMEAWVPLDSSLKLALATMLQYDAGWVAVLDRDRYLGVLTPATLHEALRRSVDADSADVDPDSVQVETVTRV
jgi:osmoprotectant transport system ATP-binding protein